MRRSAIALVFAVGIGFISQSALAADMPLKAPGAAPLALAYNWSGFYVGGNVGYGWANADWQNVENLQLLGGFGDYMPPETFSHKMSGIVGGGQIGYNYQAGTWVLGVEAMFDAAAIKGTFSSDTPFGAGDDQFEARIKMLMLFTGRVGYAWNNLLAYGKAGVGIANIRAEVSDDVGAFTGSGSESHWLTGPTVGVGIEYGITPNLSFGVEYDYLYLKSANYQLGDATGSYSWDVNIQNVNLVMAKLNYRFNWPR